MFNFFIFKKLPLNVRKFNLDNFSHSNNFSQNIINNLNGQLMYGKRNLGSVSLQKMKYIFHCFSYFKSYKKFKSINHFKYFKKYEFNR
jgi:hypothetical protein